MTLMKAKKPLALLLALLAALSLLGTTALAAGLPEETIAAQTELCGEDCGHTHEEVFSQTEHTEESLPEPEEIAVPVATPLLEQPEPEAGTALRYLRRDSGQQHLLGTQRIWLAHALRQRELSYICKPGRPALGGGTGADHTGVV